MTTPYNIDEYNNPPEPSPWQVVKDIFGTIVAFILAGILVLTGWVAGWFILLYVITGKWYL